MKIELVTTPASKNDTNLLLLGIFEGEDLSSKYPECKLGAIISNFVMKKEKFVPKFCKFYKLTSENIGFADKVLIMGLGKKSEFNLNRLREVIAKSIRQTVSSTNIENVSLSLTNILEFETSANCLQAVCEGILLGEYSFDKYKTTKEECEKISKLLITDIPADFLPTAQEGYSKGLIIANATNFAKDLINEQPNIVTPKKIADCAMEISDLDVKVFEKSEIEKMGMGAFLAVSQGGGHSPKFIHLKYTPENPKKKIAIIGKSITFDSGGLDLKPPASMLTMKDDMSGSAVVLAVMKIITQLKPDVEVHGIIASTENMVGSKAYKPGDILTAKNGKTIEVDNTDAEGRLTLADALCYADELGVDEVIDIATLTGACVVALGTFASGVMGNDDKMIKNIVKSGSEVGENMWEMPMFDDYKESLKSDIADMKNTGSRYGGASTAGVFLSNFVKNSKWTHIDIAGTAYLEKPQHECSKGASGTGIRTIVNYILNY